MEIMETNGMIQEWQAKRNMWELKELSAFIYTILKGL